MLKPHISYCAFVLSFIFIFSLNLKAHDRDKNKKQNKPYITLLGPNNLTEVRVNIENYEVDGKKIKKSAIDFGDGTVVLNKKDVFHKYAANQKYTLTIKTWNPENQLSVYAEVIDINSQYKVKDIANSSVLGLAHVQDEKKYRLALTEAQAAKLYKLTLTQTPAAPHHKHLWWHKENRENRDDKCRHDFNIEINEIEIFKDDEVDCDSVQLERFVLLTTSNIIKLETDRHHKKSSYNVEIHAVEIIKDITGPVLSSSVQAGGLTRNNAVHISVTDESAVATYVWNNQQELLGTITEKDFDLILNEGLNNFILQSVDAYNNKSDYLYLTNINLDTTAPNINAILASEYIYSSYPQTFTLTVNSDEDLQWLTINNVAATQIGPRNYIYLLTVNEPTTQSLEIKALDLAGNENIKIYNPIFSIENTPPVISPTLANNSFTNQNAFQVTITDNSNTTTEVYLNNQLVQTTTEKTFTLSLVNEGVNNFLIKSKDQYNNEALDLSLSITYDITPPQLLHNIQDVYYTNVVPYSIPIGFKPSEPLQRFVTGNDVVITTTDGIYRFRKPIAQAGGYLVNATATDLAGNVTTFRKTFPVILDTDAPVLLIDPVPEITSENSVPVHFYVNELNPVKTEIRVNNVLVLTSALREILYTAELPMDGTYHVDIKSTDSAGNITDKTLTILKQSDLVPPVITHQLQLQYSINQLPQIIPVRFVSDEPLKTFEVDNQVVTSDSMVYLFDKIVTAANSNQITIKATDLFGNVTTATYNFNVILDVTPPIINLGVADDYFTNSTSFLLPVSIDDQSLIKTEIFLNQSSISLVSEKNFSYLIDLPNDGVYSVLVVSTDEAGNISTKNISVTRDRQVLALTVLSPQDGAVLNSQTIAISFASNKAIKKAYINNVEVPVSTDMKSVSYSLVSADEGLVNLSIKVEDQFGGTIEKVLSVEIGTGALAWNYQECPVE